MKANPIPQTQRRYEQMFEYMFVLSKGKPTTFNPIMEKCVMAGKPQQWGRSINTDERTAKYLRADDVQMTRETKIHGNVFTYGIGGEKTGHPAVFPEKLAADQINSWSNEGDAVLDPFMGSGTTAVACIKEKRHFIGFELNKEYYDKACLRIDAVKRQLTLF
jgi:site-specific DNA-methyltransferase (adenine-specific)